MSLGSVQRVSPITAHETLPMLHRRRVSSIPIVATSATSSSQNFTATPSSASQQLSRRAAAPSRPFRGPPAQLLMRSDTGVVSIVTSATPVSAEALSQWMAERAVLPIENSLGGSIHAVYDLLIRYNLHIVGETSLAINHCLMALPGTKIGDLKRVMSHPQV
eukprot:gene30936-35992_t